MKTKTAHTLNTHNFKPLNITIMDKSITLKYKTKCKPFTKGVKNLFIECVIGFKDNRFSATLKSYFYEKGEKDFLHMGTNHEQIKKYFPQFSMFTRLHLCDINGIPLNGVENIIYHIRNGINSADFYNYYKIAENDFFCLLYTSDAADE